MREFADRHLMEHATRSAKRGRWAGRRNLVSVASPQESRAHGGEERSPTAVGRAGAIVGRGRKGIGRRNSDREGGEGIYKHEKLFLEREEEEVRRMREMGKRKRRRRLWFLSIF